MKKFLTRTSFTPLQYTDEGKLIQFTDSRGNNREFKTRKAVEKFCIENRCMYVENKFIFYR